jgi:hypothetical protein
VQPPGGIAWPEAAEHCPGETVEAVRLAGCDGVVEQAAIAPALKMPMINARIMTDEV